MAGGKGVLIPTTSEEAIAAVYNILDEKCFGDAGNTIVIEDFLQGTEISFMVFTDGITVREMPEAQVSKVVVFKYLV